MHSSIRKQLSCACFVTVLCAVALSGAQPGPVVPVCSLSLRFHGNGFGDIDRVKIPVDDPADSLPGPPADIGATDFTLEFWMKAFAAENPAPDVECGANSNWRLGHVVVDRDRLNQDRDFGISIAGGHIVFGVGGDGTGDLTICSGADILDGSWHLVSVQRRRSDGWLWIYVDGMLSGQGDGPDGDISYPDDGIPGDSCGGPCVNSDPFLVIGAEKHDAGAAFRSYSGWIYELHLSNVLRYTTDFTPPETGYWADEQTAALYHFMCDWEDTNRVIDFSVWPPGGPSDGERRYGGDPPGPVWDDDHAVRPGWPVDAPEESWPRAGGARLLVLRGHNSEEIRFVAFLPEGTTGAARLTIHDVAGRRVTVLSGIVSDRRVEFLWNRVAAGRTVGRGVYLATLRTPSHTLTRKFVVR